MTEQVALFGWAEYNEAYYPELRLLYAIPNGGHRHKAMSAELKAEGVKPGVPNLCLPRRPLVICPFCRQIVQCDPDGTMWAHYPPPTYRRREGSEKKFRRGKDA